jgi:hypothetical protein
VGVILRAYSINAAKTNNIHTLIQMSIALMYDTPGRLAREPELCVVMVRDDASQYLLDIDGYNGNAC